MKKIYNYQEGFLTLVDLENKKSSYVAEESLIEDNSNLLFIPTKLEVFSNEKEILEDFSNNENKQKFLKNTNFLINYDNKNSKIYLTEINALNLKSFKTDKNIKIFNVIETFIKNIGFEDFIKSELVDIIIIIKLAEEENLIFNINYENEKFSIYEVKKLGDMELMNFVLDLKRKKEKINKFLKLYTNNLTEDLKNLFTFNDFNENPDFDELKLINNDNKMYKEMEFNNFLNDNTKEADIILANTLYSDINKKKLKSWITTGLSTVITILSLYGILVMYDNYINENYQEELNIAQSDLKIKKDRLSLLQVVKTHDIINKTEKRDWTSVPYLISYIENVGLNIKSLEVVKINGEFIAQVLISGEIPKNLINIMEKNLNLVDYQIKTNVNQYSEGQLYVLNFNLTNLETKILK